jgi:hypothetical protein
MVLAALYKLEVDFPGAAGGVEIAASLARSESRPGAL